jgi:hypothetical protein
MERRKKSRQPAFLGGTIVYNRRLWSTACVVKNQTERGARLSARDLSSVPDEFELAIPQRKGAYWAKVRWRRKSEMGVTIEPVETRASSFKPVSVSAILGEDDPEAVRRSLVESIE